MINDRTQKQLALHYSLSLQQFPQLELEVVGGLQLGSKRATITDIDLFAISASHLQHRKLLIDCKTRKGESPINRSLWQRGLMDLIGAENGICIVKNDRLDPEHRQVAAKIGVTLLNESEFVEYMDATTSLPMRELSKKSYLSKLDLWDEFFGISKKFPSLSEVVDHSKCRFWMTSEPGQAIRGILTMLTRLKGEFDPENKIHVALVLDSASLFSLALSRVTGEIFAGFLKPGTQEQLSEVLLHGIYGGRESYNERNKLRKMFVQAKSGVIEGAALSLPDWDTFVQLVRQVLDKPGQFMYSPLLLREFAWSKIANSVPGEFASYIAQNNEFSAKFGILALEYLVRATGLPRELSDQSGKILMGIQRPKL